MDTSEGAPVSSSLVMQVYGASAACVRAQRDSIMGVEAGKKVVKSEETGLVLVDPEIYTTAKCGGGDACGGYGGGGGEGELFCLIVIAVLMSIFAVVWAAVMITFSVVTLGGFIRRRYRTLLEVQTASREFLGKIAVLLVRNGGVLRYALGRPYYDQWVKSTFSLFMRKKYIRQVSMFLGFMWGLIEVANKAYSMINPAYDYYLWYFREAMILVFAPLILYSPVLEYAFRRAFSEGREITEQLVHEEPLFNPDTEMQFSRKPSVIDMPTRIKSPITPISDFDQ